MIRIDEALRPADLRRALARMWELSAREDPRPREGLGSGRRLAGLHRSRVATPHGAGPTGRRASSSAPRSCSSTPPATSRFLELGRERTFSRMAPHVTHMGVHDHGFNNVSTWGALRRLDLEGRYEAEGRERDLCELALKASGAVQARRWTRIADGGGFIYSFNGPHSLFVDTVRSLRALALAHRLGHVLLEEGDAAGLAARAPRPARPGHRAVLRLLRRGSRRLGRARAGGPREPLRRRERQLPLPLDPAGLLALHDLDARAGLGRPRLRRGARVPRDRSRRRARAARRPGRDRGLHAGGGPGHGRRTSCTTTPPDGVPYWDTGAPGLRGRAPATGPPTRGTTPEPVDSSAAAIAAQGLLRLGRRLEAGGGDGRGASLSSRRA